MGEAGGRRPPAPRAPAPPHPRLPGGSGSRTRGPASRLALAAPPACQGRAWGAGTRADAAGHAESWAPDPSAPPHPPYPCLACAQGTATDAAGPLPPRRPAAARCGRMWGPGGGPGAAPSGGGGGRDSSSSLRRRAASAEVLFTKPNKVGRRRAFPRSALARVKRSGWRPAESRPAGKEPRISACWQRAEGRTPESRGPGPGDPSSYAPPPPFHPGVAAAPSETGTGEGSGPPAAWGRDGALLSEQRGTCATPSPHN